MSEKTINLLNTLRNLERILKPSIEVLQRVVNPWIDSVRNGRPYIFRQESVPANKSTTPQVYIS